MAITVESTSTSEETSNTTTHTVTMPSGVTSGDLLIALIAVDAASDETITMTGWTSLFSTLATDSETAVFYRVSDGTEGASETFTTSGSEQSTHAVYRISGYSGTPEAGTPNTGTSTTPNPSAVTPAGGSNDYLYIAVMGSDGSGSGAPTVSGYPTGYTGSQTTLSGTGLGSTVVAMATKQTTASTTDNPDAFTQSGGTDWVAATIAITPSGGGVAPKSHHLRYHL